MYYLCDKIKIQQKMSKCLKTKALCIAMLLSIVGINAQAQLAHLEQSIFLNGNIPTSNFATNNDLIPMTQNHIGEDAIMGMGIGYRVSYRFDIGFGEVSPYLHADFNWNSIRSSHRDAYTTASCKQPNYFNIPVYAGVNYRYKLTEIFTPFAEFGLGMDYFLISKESGVATDATGHPANVTLRYKPSNAFAWQIGVGTFLGQHVSASLHYSGYGKHTLKYTEATASTLDGTNLATDGSISTDQLRRVGLLSFRIGFHF